MDMNMRRILTSTVEIVVQMDGTQCFSKYTDDYPLEAINNTSRRSL
jgi:hypothetical protein